MEQQEDDKSFFTLPSLPRKPGPLFMMSICLTGVSCTTARLALTRINFDHRLVKIPVMCQGILATVNYESLAPSNAFILTSASNAIASIISSGESTCQAANYSFDNSDKWLHRINSYLISVSVLSLVWFLIPQPLCWYWVFTKGCERRRLRHCFIACVAMFALEAGAVYMSVRSDIRRLEGLSLAILYVCSCLCMKLKY